MRLQAISKLHFYDCVGLIIRHYIFKQNNTRLAYIHVKWKLLGFNFTKLNINQLCGAKKFSCLIQYSLKTKGAIKRTHVRCVAFRNDVELKFWYTPCAFSCNIDRDSCV